MKPAFDITIIMPPMWHPGWPWPAPAFICETLRQNGYRVQFLDLNAELYRQCAGLGLGRLWQDDAYIQAWCRGELNYLAQLVDLDRVDSPVIGISTTQTNMAFSVALADLLRRRFPNHKIIFGGHGVNLREEAGRVPVGVADAICKGEGEGVIIDVMAHGFTRIDEIPGLYLAQDGVWRLTTERTLETNLDKIPFPTYKEIRLDLYDHPFLPLMGSRGCIGRCIFCTDRYRTPGFRSRSAKNQVDELEYLSSHFKVEHFPYHDPLLNGDISLLQAKTNEIIKRNLKVSYGGNLMTRAGMPDELFPRLRASGMTVALIGLESGSATTLRNMRKRHNPAMAADFVRRLHQAGIRVELNFIVGFPTETEAHFQETLDWIKDNQQNIDAVVSAPTFCMVPSDLWDLREKFNIVFCGGDAYHDWYVRGGQNTFEIRQHRLERFMQFVGGLGLISGNVLSDNHVLKAYNVPTDMQFLELYRAKASPTEPTQTEAANRLAAAIRKREGRMKPIELFSVAISSFRRRGIRQTMQRAKEWLHIRSRRGA